MIKNWIAAARPKTLSAAVVPILVSWAVVKTAGGVPRLEYFLLALFSSFFIQIGTNFVNDASDFKSGKDTVGRLGPERITAQGWMSYKTVMIGAGVSFFIAFLLGIPLVLAGGWPILTIGLLSLAAGYAYTSGPYPLAYHGLGEVFVILFFGIIAVAGMVFLHMPMLPAEVWIAGAQTGSLCSVLLAINNYRDIVEDRSTGKKTLAARFGENFARNEISFFIFFPYILGGLYAVVTPGHAVASILPLVSLPLAWKIHSQIQRSRPSRDLNRFIGLSSLLYIVFGMLLTIGLGMSRYDV